MSYVLKNKGANGKTVGRSATGSDYMLDPGARLYATGDVSIGGIIGTVIDVLTSRPGALAVAGTLTYLLVKSPAARKELWGTAKGEYGKAKGRLKKKSGPQLPQLKLG